MISDIKITAAGIKVRPFKTKKSADGNKKKEKNRPRFEIYDIVTSYLCTCF